MSDEQKTATPERVICQDAARLGKAMIVMAHAMQIVCGNNTESAQQKEAK